MSTSDEPSRTRADADAALARALDPLLSAAPTAIVVADAEGVVRYANRGLGAALPRPTPGRPLLDLAPERDRARLRAALEQALAGRAATLEVGEGSLAGPDPCLQVDVGPATFEGRPHVVVTAVDVTERKRSEARLRHREAILVDAQGVAHMGTWEWDLSQPHATWSDELYRIYGLTPDAYVPSYEGYLRMVHPDDRARVMEVTERAVKEHVPYSHDERIFRPDGSMRYLHTWAHPVVDGEGRLVRLVGVCQDVTEQRHAEGTRRTQTLTRALARRLLVDLIARAHVPPGTVRELGRSLARAETGEALAGVQAHVEVFADLGLGNLRFERQDGNRYAFAATDLIERRADSPLPTCFMTLGYLEGVVATITGRRALGNEMRCQSMGHKECSFMVMEQTGGT